MGDFMDLQNALLETKSVEDFLHEMAVIASRQVTDGLSCGMTMEPHGRPLTVACSDELVSQVDEVQYRLDDGPCLHAMRDGEMVTIEDTADQAHWPVFESEAAEAGIRSCLALPLMAGGESVGALNLYARSASAFGDEETRRAESFAENASGALTLAKRLASYTALNEQLRASMASRSLIDQAMGIVMAREKCTQAHAFEMLRKVSQNTNVKLRDLAKAIVTSVTGEPAQPPAPFEEDPNAAATLG
jgi:transcriptional regulator with GAF, ATPase, and Fis domain